MGRFFRFSVRDLLWLTAVVGLALAWGIRERSQFEVNRAAERADKWKRAPGALEHVLTNNRWAVDWDWLESKVHLRWPSDSGDETPLQSFSVPFDTPASAHEGPVVDFPRE